MLNKRFLQDICFPFFKSHYYINKYLLIKSLNVVLSCVIKLSIIALQLKEEDCTQIRKARKGQEFTGIFTELFLLFKFRLPIQALCCIDTFYLVRFDLKVQLYFSNSLLKENKGYHSERLDQVQSPAPGSEQPQTWTQAGQ